MNAFVNSGDYAQIDQTVSEELGKAEASKELRTFKGTGLEWKYNDNTDLRAVDQHMVLALISEGSLELAVCIFAMLFFHLLHPSPRRHSPESSQCSSFFVNVKVEKLMDTSLSPLLYFTGVVITTDAMFG